MTVLLQCHRRDPGAIILCYVAFAVIGADDINQGDNNHRDDLSFTTLGCTNEEDNESAAREPEGLIRFILYPILGGVDS